jgi:hypothetical protein
MIDILFDSSWKKIAISLSGGADSALLTFLICSQVTNQEIHIINHIRCWKSKPWQEDDANRVFTWFKNKFPHILFIKHTNFIAPDLEYGNQGPTITDEYGKLVSGDNAEIRSFAEYICFKHNIDSYYNGVTRNPKNVMFKGMLSRDIDANDNNKHLFLMDHMNRKVIHPFRFIEKDKILMEYKNLNIMELFNITRSCEGDKNTYPAVFGNLDFTTYKKDQFVPICSQCFWCKEREWAIEQSTY